MLGSLIAGVIVNKNDALPLYKNEIVQIFLLIAQPALKLPRQGVLKDVAAINVVED